MDSGPGLSTARPSQARAPSAWTRDRITDPGVRGRLSKRRDFAVGEIEAYLRCPRSWFLTRVVAPARPARGFDARRRSEFARGILADAYRRLTCTGGRVTEATVSSVLEWVDEAWAERSAGLPAPSSLEEHERLRTAREWAYRIVREDVGTMPGFRPVAVDWTFGGPTAVDVGGVRVSGTVDRIDRSGDALLVTDYAPRRGPDHVRFADRGLVRLPLAAAAAAAAFSCGVAGGVYRGLDAGGCRGFLRRDRVPTPPPVGRSTLADGETIERVLREARVRVRRAVEGMRDGYIPARATRNGTCVWCPGRPSCER